jgi:hypothetical protein
VRSASAFDALGVDRLLPVGHGRAMALAGAQLRDQAHVVEHGLDSGLVFGP